MWWVDPGWQLNPHPTARSFPSQQDGGENWKSKSWKLVDLDKESLISEIKLHKQAKKNKEFIHYLPAAGNSVPILTDFRNFWARSRCKLWNILSRINIYTVVDEFLKNWYFQGSRSSACLKVTWEDKHHKHECLSFLILSLRFYCWAQHHTVRNTPLASS